MNNKTIAIDNPLLCPQCLPNKTWYLKTYPFSDNILKKSSLKAHKCKDCGVEFSQPEKAKAILVKSVEKCIHCGSSHIGKISKPNADLELYFCKQCRCYMVVE